LYFIIPISPSYAQEKSGISCSIILEGVKKNKINMDFYENVCAFGSRNETLRTAIISGDPKSLKSFKPSLNTAGLLKEILQEREFAIRMFKSIKNEDSLAWFKAVIDAGLDPNLLIDDETGRYSILRYAIWANNVPAALILLKAGAFAHSYSRIWGDESLFPEFIFPLESISELAASSEEKRELIAAMAMSRLKVITIDQQEKLGVTGSTVGRNWLQIISAAGVSKESIGWDSPTTKVCKDASRISGYDWCLEQKKVAKFYRLADMPERDMLNTFTQFRMIGPIAVYEDSLYYLTITPGYERYNAIGIASVRKGGDRLEFYKYIGNGVAGLGHCSRLRRRAAGEEPGDFSDTDRNAECWRLRSLSRPFGIKEYESNWGQEYIATDREY
jgi:hypothetical protein